MALLHMQVTSPALFSKGWQPVPGWPQGLAHWDEVMPRQMGQAQASLGTGSILALLRWDRPRSPGGALGLRALALDLSQDLWQVRR